MIYVLSTVHILVCIFLILVVLLQQGKGADLSVFGGGGTQTVFGARGAATLLHKMTVGAFVAFIFTTVAIGFVKSGGSGASVMSTAAEAESVDPAAEDGGETVPPAAAPAGEESGAGGTAEEPSPETPADE